MVVLILIFIGIVLALIFLPFTKDLMKDKSDLRSRPIEVRFKVLIDEINRAFLDGLGTTVYPVKSNPRWLNLHSDHKANYLIQFNYSTGHLTVYLNYLYFHQELKANVPFYNVREADLFTQKRMANEFIQKMQKAILEHQQKIGIPNQTEPVSSFFGSTDSEDPMATLSSMYGGLSLSQRKSVINMGYQIFSANGDSWAEYIGHATTRQQLNMMNLNWQDCKTQLDDEGENLIYSDLLNIGSGEYDMSLMFWLSLVATEYGPNQARADNFLEMNAKLGHSEEDIEERINKVEAIMKFFGQG